MSGESRDGDIEVSLVVKDDDVKKALGTIEAEGAKTSKKTKDIKFFDFQKMKEEGISGIEDLAGNIGKFGIAAAGVGATLFLLKKGLDFSVQGEQILAINNQFDMLARSAGVVPDKLREGLNKASDGLLGMEAILKSANSMLINMGDSAARLPEVLQLARKVTAVLGGDLQERFSGIVSAIESGNAKALKAQGIIIDADKAMRDYAGRLGLASSELNQAQKQQAILNAALQEGEKKFRDVQTSIQPVHDRIAQIRTDMGDIVDNFKRSVAESGTFLSILKGIQFYTNMAAKGVGKAMESKVGEQIEELIRERTKIEALLQGEGKKDDSIFGFGKLQSRLNIINKQIQELGGKTQATEGFVLLSNKKLEKSEESLAGSTLLRRDAQQEALYQSRLLSIESQKLQSSIDGNSAEINRTALLTNEWDRRQALLSLYKSKEVLLEQDHANKLRELELQRQGSAIQTTTEYENRKLQITNAFAVLNRALDLERQKALMEYTATATAGITGFEAAFAGMEEVLDGAKAAAKDFAISAAANFRNMGKQMFNTVGSGAAQAFAAFGKAIVDGGNALEAFANSLLATMGQMAIQLGMQFILQGAAYLYAGMANGVPLMAAGAALAAFGGIMSGFAGQASSSPSTSGGGAVASPESPAAQIVEPDKLERKGPDTTINFNGPILGDENSAMYIADLLNQFGAKNGIKLVGLT